MRYLYLLLITFSLYSCNDKETTGPTDIDTSVIMPLKKGNYWIYKSGEYNESIKGWVTFRIDTTTVIGDTVLDGEKWYPLKSSNFIN